MWDIKTKFIARHFATLSDSTQTKIVIQAMKGREPKAVINFIGDVIRETISGEYHLSKNPKRKKEVKEDGK